MTIADTLRNYLDESEESMRALSLRAGLGEKAVSDILRLKGLKPTYKTIEALSKVTGIDLAKHQKVEPSTYQTLIDRLKVEGKTRSANRVGWMVKAAGWVPQTKIVCRREVVEFFETQNAARFGLSNGSYSTYKSEAIAVVTDADVRNRQRNVTDLGGIYAKVYEALKDSDLENWRVGQAGSFIVFLDEQNIAPHEITTETLGAYFARRLEVSAKSEKKCRDHVKEIAVFLGIVSEHPDLSQFGFCAVPHPFGRATGKYGIDNEVIDHLLIEFDDKIAPWALGKTSRDGMSRDEFIAALDQLEPEVSGKKAELHAKRKVLATRPGQAKGESSKSNDKLLAASGFLTPKQRWNKKTLANRRGYIASLAKSIAASVEIVPDTLHELLDPDFLEVPVDSIKASNTGEFPSAYIGSVLKCVMKVASEFQCRSDEEIGRIDELLKSNNRKHRGIAPRNRAKLRKFKDKEIQMTIDLGDTLISAINREIDRRRMAHKRKQGVLPQKSEVIDHELTRDIIAVIAHEILIRAALRSDNVINARLDWVAWIDGHAVMTIPAEGVKMRNADDDDLRIHLDERCSNLLDIYLDTLRAKVLLKGDDRNPYVFPRQGGSELNKPYGNLLGRVTKLLHQHVGIKIHPHLYRHLIGWIWLKDSLNNLPKVQRILGHKSLQTTLDYYAELDASLVFDQWQDILNRRRSI